MTTKMKVGFLLIFATLLLGTVTLARFATHGYLAEGIILFAISCSTSFCIWILLTETFESAVYAKSIISSVILSANILAIFTGNIDHVSGEPSAKAKEEFQNLFYTNMQTGNRMYLSSTQENLSFACFNSNITDAATLQREVASANYEPPEYTLIKAVINGPPKPERHSCLVAICSLLNQNGFKEQAQLYVHLNGYVEKHRSHCDSFRD